MIDERFPARAPPRAPAVGWRGELTVTNPDSHRSKEQLKVNGKRGINPQLNHKGSEGRGAEG